MKNKFTTISIILITVVLAGIAIFTAIRLYQTRDQAVAPNVPSSKPAAAGQMCGGFANATCPPGERCVLTGGTVGVCQTVSTSEPKDSVNSCSLNFTLVSGPTSTPTAKATATATATPVPECNSTCSINADCPTSLICHKEDGESVGNCRNNSCLTSLLCVCSSSTPTPTATATATATANPQCNNSCTQNTDCPNGLMCNIPSGATSGNCRNTSCLSEADCLCPVATGTAPVAEKPELPDAGTSWPTVLGTAFGFIVILGSLLLAL